MTTPQATPLAGGAPPRFVPPPAEPTLPPEPGRFVAAAALVGLLAGAWLPYHDAGLALTIVALATLLVGGWQRGGTWRRACLAAAALLALTPLLRDADWVVTVALVGSITFATIGLAAGTTWKGVLRPAVRWPLELVPASVSLLVATQHAASRRRLGALGPVARGLLLAAPLVFVFGALFAAADAAFLDLVDDVADLDRLIPDGWEVRLGLGVLVTLTVLALRATASRAELPGPAPLVAAPADSAPLFSRVEWGIALGALVTLFGLFVGMQLRVLFGDDGYVLRRVGLTYAEYARQGFGQLTFVAALTLAVIAVVAARGPIDDRLIRLLCAALCLLTLVVVASAWHRLSLYESAFGATRLRFSTHAALLWFAGTFTAVLIAGAIRGGGRRLPRVIVALTACLLIGFVAVNPDGRIATDNVDRSLRGGDLDEYYLGELSTDAAPAIARLGARQRACPLSSLAFGTDRTLAAYNLSRRRAGRIAANDPGAGYCRTHGSPPRRP